MKFKTPAWRDVDEPEFEVYECSWEDYWKSVNKLFAKVPLTRAAKCWYAISGYDLFVWAIEKRTGYMGIIRQTDKPDLIEMCYVQPLYFDFEYGDLESFLVRNDKLDIVDWEGRKITYKGIGIKPL